MFIAFLCARRRSVHYLWERSVALILASEFVDCISTHTASFEPEWGEVAPCAE